MQDLMLFNSINFFLFLFIVTALNYLLSPRFRWILMLIASIVFYAIGGLSTIAVPVVIILSTFYCGKLIQRSSSDSRKKLFFFVGLYVTLGLLIFYKYINFFLGVAFDLTNLFAKYLPLNLPTHNTSLFLNLVIPLGISYISFQAIGYLIEIKRGNHLAEEHLGYFATYLFFFPKLLSGPIERAHNFLPQLKYASAFDFDEFVLGLKRIVWGLFKKLVIANRISIYTDAIFSNSSHHSGLTLLIASFLYTIQIYADFSGYTDMALGTARLIGFRLMENFNNPFSSKSVSEFWRNWHISLSSWVSDYIYNPIAINKRYWNKWASVYAAMVTFIILGFWHGASWCYIVFGFIQGVIISFELFTKKSRKIIRSKLPPTFVKFFCHGYVFVVFTFSLIFFRSETLSIAFNIIGNIFHINSSVFVDLNTMGHIFIGLFVFMLVRLYMKKNNEIYIPFESAHWFKSQLFYLFLIIVILMVGVLDGGQFIYFQF